MNKDQLATLLKGAAKECGLPAPALGGDRLELCAVDPKIIALLNSVFAGLHPKPFNMDWGVHLGTMVPMFHLSRLDDKPRDWLRLPEDWTERWDKALAEGVFRFQR